MPKKLILFGISSVAHCAFEYFTHDSDYDVVAFAVDGDFMSKNCEVLGKPVVPFESIEKHFAPHDHSMFIAVGAQKLNQLRANKVAQAKEKGYAVASYISSRAFIWPNAQIGEHAFIQENNTLQPFVIIGNNVTLWANNHIGHSTRIDDNCFIASHVVLCGHSHIGENTYIGVNASISDNVSIARDNVIGMNASIIKNTEENTIHTPPKSERSPVSARKLFGLKDA